MNKVLACTAFVTCFLLRVAMLDAQQGSLSGRVFDAGSGRGIPALTVQLQPPTAVGKSQNVTFTDTEGRFRLPNLGAGRYLLTISQGSTLLHREVVEVNGDTAKDVGLQRR